MEVPWEARIDTTSDRSRRCADPIASYRGGRGILAAALGLIGLVLAVPSTGAGTSTPIVIGAVCSLHGFQANLDIPSARGAQLAVDEVNREGGVLGREVRLAIVDGISKPTVIQHKTFSLFKRFREMPAVIGLSDTDMVLAAAPVAASA